MLKDILTFVIGENPTMLNYITILLSFAGIMGLAIFLLQFLVTQFFDCLIGINKSHKELIDSKIEKEKARNKLKKIK